MIQLRALDDYLSPPAADENELLLHIWSDSPDSDNVSELDVNR